MPFLTNPGLLEALKKGDRKAFDELFRSFYPQLMGYTRLMVEEEVARDIVQDVFLYVWEKRTTFDYGPKFRSYLFQLCYSRAIDHLRHKKHIESEFSQQVERLLDMELKWMKQNNNEIIESLFNRELLEQIEQLIQQLPEQRREVFKLSFLHDMDNNEISNVLDMPKRTVESHLYLSLKFLRNCLKDKEFMLLLLLTILKF